MSPTPLLVLPGSTFLAGAGLLVAGATLSWLYFRRDVRRRRELEKELAIARRELGQNEQVLSEVNNELTRMVVDRDRKARWLEEAKTRAEAATQAKGRFLASMSHELRTPLNSVIGFSNQLLKNKHGRLGERDLVYLRKISENGEHLLGLVDRILNMARVESGRMEVEMVPAPVDALVREVVDQLQGDTPNGGVELRARIPDELDPLTTDPAKLKQVLINLVGNALRFTERGEVEITVRADEERRPLCIEVRDDGIGIPEDRLDSIFEAFEQAEQDTTRTHGGTGLGLALCRSLCDLMGYGLEVESEVGVGSTFRITFPVGPRVPEEEPSGTAPELDRTRT